MSSSLQNRFLAVQEQLLSAYMLGDEALSDFVKDWTSLSQDFTSAMEAQQIDPGTLSIVQATATTVTILADTLICLDVEAHNAWNIVLPNIRDILSQVDEQAASTLPTCSSDAADQSLSTVAQDWLLSNLHDPYPCSAMKASIAARSGCTVKEVQQWFSDTRRHIGWTALCQERFSGSRRLTSEAATRAYHAEGDASDIPIEVQRAFTAIEANARKPSLERRTPPSDERYVYHVHPTSPFGQSSAGHEENASDAHKLQSSFQASSVDQRRSSLSSSVSTEPPVLVFDEDEDEDMTPPPSIAGHKRRLVSTTDSIDDGLEQASPTQCKPRKRHRSTSSSSTQLLELDSPQACVDPYAPVASQLYERCVDAVTNRVFPNPISASRPSTRLEGGTSSEDSLEAMETSAHIPPTPISSRKRRLSETVTSRLAKRPRSLASGPRRQTVSDPIPVCLNSNQTEVAWLDEWLRSIDNVPAVDTGNLSPSFLLDFELAPYPATSGESLSALSSSASHLDVPDADLVAATPDDFDLSTFNFSEFPSNFDLSDGLSFTPSVGSSCPSPLANASLDLSQSALMENSLCADWSQFVDLLNSLDSSPTSSEISSSNSTGVSQMSDSALSDDAHTLFGANPPFTPSGLLSDIGELSSLHMPLEVII